MGIDGLGMALLLNYRQLAPAALPVFDRSGDRFVGDREEMDEIEGRRHITMDVV